MTDIDPGPLPLPDFPLEEDIEEMVAAIQRRGRADPVALALQGVEIFLHLSQKRQLDRPMEVNLEIRGLCRALARAQPACAPLVNLANDMIKPLEAFYGRGEGERMREDLRARAEGWRDELFALEHRRILRTAQLVSNGGRLLLYGYGTDLVDALRQARAAGLQFTVAAVDGATDPSPALIDALRQHEIPAESLPLAEAATATHEQATVLLGAYSLSPSGLVHWRGTSALARLARQRQIPIYCVCGPERFFPAGYAVWLPGPAEGTDDAAAIWEWTPLDLLTGVVTGEGTLSGEGLCEALTRRRVEAALLG